ncbi:MAG: hypothetical protein ACYTEQ_01160 [Planctomycetota bacterium]|jgi:hypothetical protein
MASLGAIVELDLTEVYKTLGQGMLEISRYEVAFLKFEWDQKFSGKDRSLNECREFKARVDKARARILYFDIHESLSKEKECVLNFWSDFIGEIIRVWGEW